MNEFQIQQFVRGVLIPAVLSGGVFLAATLLPGRLRSLLRAWGMAAGWTSSLFLISGPPSWPSWGSPGGLWYTAVLLWLWPLVEEFSGRRTHLRRYLVLASVVAVVLKPLMFGNWDEMRGLSVMLTVATGATVVWYAAQASIMLISPLANVVLFLWVGTTSSLLMMSEGSALLAQLTGAYCAVLGGVLVFAGPRFFKAHGEHLPAAVLGLLSLILAHFFYVEADLSLWLIALSPFLLMLARTSFGGVAQSPLKEAATLSLVSFVPLGWVLWQVYQALASSPY